MWRIAVVHHGSPSSLALARLRQGLQRQGLVEGVNCIVDAAGTEGRWQLLPMLIERLQQCSPDVLVAIGALAALSAQRATARVRIVHAIVLDAQEIGLTAPNVSGVSTFDPDQGTHHAQLLLQLVPGLSRVALLTDADAPKGLDGRNPLVTRFMQAAAAHKLDVTCVALSGIDAELEPLFATVRQAHAQALVALEVPAVLARLADIVGLAERHRLPALTPYGWPETGVVMQGAALLDAMDPLAQRIAALTRDACAPDMQSCGVRHERLVVHRGRARRIGLSIPARVLDRATHIIDDEAVSEVTAACRHRSAP